MPLTGLRTAVAALCLGLTLLPAAAADDYCVNPSTGQVDQRATAQFRQLDRSPDARFMRVLAGRWYSEVGSPSTGQISRLLQSFARNGLYDYANQVCTSFGCSVYQGTGLHAVRRRTSTAFVGLIIVSDLNRNHQCVGLSGRVVNADTIALVGGGIMRRVR